jgi:hypothetical protein
MFVTQNDLFQILQQVQTKLRSYVDIEISEHKILQDDLNQFTSYVYDYTKDDFAKMKEEIKLRYSRENIYTYVELLQHNRDYITLRYSSEDQMDQSKMIEDLTQLLQRFFENDVLNINEDFYYIIFENYQTIQSWMKDYCRNYAIIISHYIFTK